MTRAAQFEIVETSMPETMLQDMLLISARGFDHFLAEDAEAGAEDADTKAGVDEGDGAAELAAYVKQNMDDKYGSTWQCVAGRRFGGSVHSLKDHAAFFYIGKTAILVYKTKTNYNI